MAELDGNELLARGSVVDISGKTAVGLFVRRTAGSSNNVLVTIEVSPDNTNWYPSGYTMTGEGYRYFPICASYARTCIAREEGEDCTLDVTAVYN